MNKSEMEKALAEKTSLTQKQAKEFLDAQEEICVESLERGEKVQLAGFFTAEPVGRSARKGYNPNTKQELDIQERMGVKMSPGKRMERAVENLNTKDFMKVKK